MIGIIGIAAILALSSGVNNYIDQIQYDTMSSYTITVSRTTVDLNAMLAAGGMGGLGGSSGSGSSSSSGGSTSQDMTKVHADYSDIKQSEAVANSIKSNNLNDFKKYLDNPNSDIRQYLGENGVVYSYDVNFSVLATNPDGGLIDTDADADALSAGSVNGSSGWLVRPVRLGWRARTVRPVQQLAEWPVWQARLLAARETDLVHLVAWAR